MSNEAIARIRAAVAGRDPSGYTEVSALDLLALAQSVPDGPARGEADVMEKAARRSLRRDPQTREILPGQESRTTNPLTGVLVRLLGAVDGAA